MVRAGDVPQLIATEDLGADDADPARPAWGAALAVDDGWATPTAPLVLAEGGVSQTLSVFHQGGRWYALSKRDGDLGDQLAFWIAPGSAGPFAPTDPVATIAADSAAGAVAYMPLAHPRILPERGTMVVSYSRNNTDFDRIRADPTLYRPTFLRVPLPD